MKLFKKRMIIDEQVFLFTDDCADILGISVSDLYQKTDRIISSERGDLLPETEFNRILQTDFRQMPTCLQITSCETLQAKAENLIRFQPVKTLFTGLHPDGSYEQSEEFRNDLQKEMQKMLRQQPSAEDKILEYRSSLSEGILSVPETIRKDLQIRTITIIKETHLIFETYCLGKGIFKQVMPEYMEEEFNNPEQNRQPIPGLSDRDYRQYSTFDNLIYCLQHIPGLDEWMDYIEIRAAEINVSIDKPFLMKLIHPKSCPDILYFDGIPELLP